MTKNEHTRYEPQHLVDRRNSSDFHFALYRNPETIAKEEMMEDFMDYIQDEFEMSQDEISDIQALVNSFIGYDSKKAEQGEKELLARWKESCK